MRLRDFPCRDTAVDLGSRTARVHLRGRGVVAVTPTLLALDDATGEYLAAGEEALELHARAPVGIRFVWPFEGGVLNEVETARRLLRHLLRRAHRRRYLTTPRMAVAVPSQITDVQQHALAYVACGAGARSLTMVPTPLAAALGAGIRLDEPPAVLMVDVGAVTTDLAVLSLGMIVVARTVRVGGQDLDRAIADHVRRERGVLIGLDAAASIKRRIGAAPWHDHVLVHGRDLDTGVPKPVVLTAAEIGAAVEPPLRTLVEELRSLLEHCPAETVVDLTTGGMVLTGGGAKLTGLPELLSKHTGLPARVAEDPASAVVLGCAACLSGGLALQTRRLHRDRRDGFLAVPRSL
ncbi:rod shape-determining protein [Thermomonospora catenispora]|uniref:rod shape-determining protein n=1 Tax=Thermomonospora catenispora TaxID=2493090 RepID=UPI001122BDAF|nr:rod shape-determining protein [Thermomonospora catenispora]TNY36562.1 rod shape-determining protein [Thermomonospora catenispora]